MSGEIREIADGFLLTPLAYVQAKIRRMTGVLPSECDHPMETADLMRMVCGKCGATREDIIIERAGKPAERRENRAGA